MNILKYNSTQIEFRHLQFWTIVSSTYLFLILLYPPEVFAQQNFPLEEKEIYQAFLDGSFERMDFLNEHPDRIKKGSVFFYYFKYTSEFIHGLLGGNVLSYDSLKKKESEVFSELETSKGADHWKKYCYAELKFQFAISYALQNERFSAATRFRQAYIGQEDVLALYPNCKPALLSISAMKCMLDLIPDSYQWMLSVAGMKKDLDGGIKMLQHLQQGNDLVHRESRMWLALIQTFICNDPAYAWELMLEADKKRAFISITQTESLVQSIIGLKFGKQQYLKERNEKWRNENEWKAYPILHYIQAECLLGAQNWEEADTEYQFFLQRSRGLDYRKDAYYKRFLSQSLLENQVHPFLLDSVLLVGRQVLDADKHAQKIAQKGVKTPIKLMYARLLFDSGNASLALQILEKTDSLSSLSPEVQLEYQYRIARCKDVLGMKEEAIDLYKKVFENPLSSQSYIGANSALCIGIIYYHSSAKEMAKTWFHRCLNTAGHEYSTSLKNKAKYYLSSIDK